MDMEFRLTINLGNDAMMTGEDVSVALRGVADDLSGILSPLSPYDVPFGIRDENGNRVGQFEVRT